MSDVSFPDELPCVSRVDGFGKNAQSSLVRTAFEAGNTRQRRVHAAMPTEIQLTWRVENTDLYRLLSWLNVYGFDWFALKLSGLESSIEDTLASLIDVRLTSDIAVTLIQFHKQNYWAVKATAAYMPSDAALTYVPPV